MLALALLLAVTGNPPPTCFDPVAPCPSGSTSGTEQHVDSFGTPAGSCGTCTATPSAPGGPGCVLASWDTTSPLGAATPLSIPKFRPTGNQRLSEVRLTIRGRHCGVASIEHKDPLNGCTRAISLGVQFQLDVVPGQGLDALGPLASFESAQEVTVVHAPFDGVIDFMGPSGHTEIFPEFVGERCVRITDPALLDGFVDDGVRPDRLLFDHAARDVSDLTNCGPVTFKGDTYASIELEVTYHSCAPSTVAFCFGSDAICPCANGGATESGCDNAQGTGGVRLSASGDPSTDDVVLHGSGFPIASTPAVLLLRSLGPSQAPAPFGDGVTCLPSGTLSFAGATLAVGGASSIPLQHPGSATLYYELWYRSRPAAYCDGTAALNTSNALAIDWP